MHRYCSGGLHYPYSNVGRMGLVFAKELLCCEMLSTTLYDVRMAATMHIVVF